VELFLVLGPFSWQSKNISFFRVKSEQKTVFYRSWIIIYALFYKYNAKNKLGVKVLRVYVWSKAK